MRVELRDITKSYDKSPVLGPITVEIESGLFVTVLGPSGSGKTTLLQVLAGLSQPTSGDVRFDGKVVNPISPAQRNVAMVFQRYALYPLRAYDNLALPLRRKQLSESEVKNRIARISSLLGIEPFLNRHVSQLSGGEQQRVALGRALVREPALFLLDEPLSNLDPALRGRLVVELAELHRKLAVTTIMVTHDPTEAMALGQRVMILKSGRIEQYATAEDIYYWPANRFVAEFASNYRMNFVAGRLIQKEDHVVFSAQNFEQLLPDAWDSLLKKRIDGDVLLAVRPEHLVVTSSGSLRGAVIHCERNGGDFYAVVETSLGRLTVRSSQVHRPAPGDLLSLELTKEFLHVFAASTEENLIYD